MTQRPCHNCPLRARCASPCAAVESYLSDETRDATFRVERPTKAFLRRFYETYRETKLILSWRDDLSMEDRRIFDARYNDGASTQDAALRLRYSQKNVQRRFKRIIDRIGDLATDWRKPRTRQFVADRTGA